MRYLYWIKGIWNRNLLNYGREFGKLWYGTMGKASGVKVKQEAILSYQGFLCKPTKIGPYNNKDYILLP
jgi:hypothetical protein